MSSYRLLNASRRRAIAVTLPIGDVTCAQLRRLTELCRHYGNGTLRATNDQNLVFPFIADGDLASLYGELEALRLAEPNALHLSGVTSCPGADYCSLAVTRSMGVAQRIRQHFASAHEAVEKLGKFRIKISGCPNSCGQHHIGDRSEERRVGKECTSWCRSRWSPYH